MTIVGASLNVILACLFLSACGGGSPPAVERGGEVGGAGLSTEVVRKLSGKRILFGHQSVGQNIVDGIEDLRRDGSADGIAVHVLEPGMAPGVAAGFYHARVGRNGDPESKVAAFARMVEASAPSPPDAAFFKFCYVDIGPDTDVPRLFDLYRERMSELKGKHPGILFVHVTVPLTTARNDIKSLVKRLIGKKGDREKNAKRGEFNALMRKEYVGREPVFDLASIEATRPDGSRATFELGGRRYDMLAPDYTSDFEHLDAKGRKVAARKLLSFLAESLR